MSFSNSVNALRQAVSRLRKNRIYPYILIILILLLAVYLIHNILILTAVESATIQPEPDSVIQPAAGFASSNPVGVDPSRSETLTAPAIKTSQPVAAARKVAKPKSLADLEQLINNRPSSSQKDFITFAAQPEPSIERGFLLVADSIPAARAFNSYFSFYFDWTHSGQENYPTLILDRLYLEKNRVSAMSAKTYRDETISNELRNWIETLIDPQEGAQVCAFILDCYRRDFAQRLDTQPSDTPELWEDQQFFGDLEVTYHADRESYCTFDLV